MNDIQLPRHRRYIQPVLSLCSFMPIFLTKQAYTPYTAVNYCTQFTVIRLEIEQTIMKIYNSCFLTV